MFRNAASSVWALLVVAVTLGSSARAAEPIPGRVWDDLASDHPATMASAVAALEAAGPQAVAFLRERLKPVAADAGRIDGLIKQLDSPQFVKRRQATEELEYLGKIAQPQLEKALASKPPLEVRPRVEQLLKRLQPRGVPRSETAASTKVSSVQDMVRAEFREIPGRRTPFSDLLRQRPAVALNPGLKILFVLPGGIEMTPRQVIEAARGEQASRQPGTPPLPAKGLTEAGLKQARGPRAAAPPVSPTWVRARAAVRVLERVGNNEARELLRLVAGGAADALPTVEARIALKRLKANTRP